MKLFYKITLGCLAVGLVLMGAGITTAALEISSFSYMGEKYPDNSAGITDSEYIVLPENTAKIFTEDYGEGFDLVVDEALSGNNAILEVKHSVNENIHLEPRIYANYYLYNSYTDNLSKYSVNCIQIGWSRELINDKSGFEEFKEMISDFKQKKIYDYNEYGFEPELTLKVSKEAYARFDELPEGYELLSYGAYMEQMADNETAEVIDG